MKVYDWSIQFFTFQLLYDKRLASIEHKFSEKKNIISGSSTSFEYTWYNSFTGFDIHENKTQGWDFPNDGECVTLNVEQSTLLFGARDMV